MKSTIENRKLKISKPPWLKVRAAAGGACARVDDLLKRAGLHTVCQSALCPNRHECFHRGTATIMILGDVCTRKCSFCAVKNGTPPAPDPDEPRRVAMVAKELGLKHAVITSVTRDDLNDGGAGIFAETIRQIKALLPGSTVEVLTPDFQGREADMATVLKAEPDVYNHNIETVKRLQKLIRPGADYDRSLGVLRFAAAWNPKVVVKSGLMAGLGETDSELYEAMADLISAGCEFLTIGQYLAPSPDHAPVARYVEPDMFESYRKRAVDMGFKAVAAAPLVRSSYMAEELLKNDSTRPRPSSSYSVISVRGRRTRTSRNGSARNPLRKTGEF